MILRAKLFVALLAILSFSVQLSAADVTGFVHDVQSGESIIGVNVFVKASGQGAATNVEGFFILRGISTGSVDLTFSHIAYEDTTLRIDLGSENHFISSVSLRPHALDTKAIEVVGKRTTIIKDMDISSMQVDPVILTEIPQLNKDVFKLIQFSPSVTTSDPMSPQYYVRGSDPGENLVQMDGMTIYNPQHFMGSSAIFNPYSIKNVEMLVGGFDAEYGGRNASIMNISTREGHQSEIHGEFRPSISGISGAIEFPAGENGTAMVSGRTYTDFMLRVMMGSPNLVMDYNAAYQVLLGKTRLRFSGFFARDYMDYSVDNLMLFFPEGLFDSFGEGFVTNTTNRALGVKFNSVLLPTLTLEGQVYHSASSVDNLTYFNYAITDTVEDFTAALDYKTHIENTIGENTGKASLAWYAFWKQTLKLGLEINDIYFANEVGRFDADPNPNKSGAQFQSFFVQDKIELGPLQFKLGLRNSRSQTPGSANPLRLGKQGGWHMEPRISASLRIPGGHQLKTAYGRYFQYLTTMDSKGDEFVQFLDYYQSLENREPLNSIHYIVGLNGPLFGDISYEVSAYYKDLKQLYRATYSSSIVAGESSALLEGGSGESYGFEVLLRGEFGRLSGWLGYNYSKGFRRYPSILDGETSLFDADQPHNLKSILLFKLTPDIVASSTLQITSGFPRTWETGMRMHGTYDPLTNTAGYFATYITPQRNNVRYPARFAWDIGWKKKLRSGFGFDLAEYLGGVDAYMTMTVRNLFFLHRNPVYYFYIPEYGYYGFGSGYLPSISFGYSLQF
ncbi:MAG: TonB-dependent receptor [Candidatus Marinimicrobia bacterium]|nr:TonB-dependent receptor [Candidatus Neomarinimicrobiota bacterium]